MLGPAPAAAARGSRGRAVTSPALRASTGWAAGRPAPSAMPATGSATIRAAIASAAPATPATFARSPVRPPPTVAAAWAAAIVATTATATTCRGCAAVPAGGRDGTAPSPANPGSLDQTVPTTAIATTVGKRRRKERYRAPVAVIIWFVLNAQCRGDGDQNHETLK